MDKVEKQIKAIIYDVLDSESLELIIFGSRAVGSAYPGSDYDIAIKADGKISDRLLAIIREKLEDSTIPNKIDLVDYHSVSQELKINIDKDGIRW